jgi:hypothetical protein
MSAPARRLTATAVGLALVLAMAFAASASAAPALNGTFPVKGVGTNNKIAAGPDGNMWVTVSNGEEDVARITPAGDVKEFKLQGVSEATGIAVDHGGSIWITDSNGVAKFSPSNPEETSDKTILGIAGAEAIVSAPNGEMWVGATNLVYHFPPADPTKVTKLPVLGLSAKDIDVAGSLIVVADSNNFEEGKTKFGRIVTFTAAGVEGTLRTPGGMQGLAGSPSGQIAFAAPLAVPEQSGLITPPNPAQSFELAGDPVGVARGSDEAFWIVQFTSGVLERVTSGGARSSLPGLPPESARQIAAGPGNTLWVTLGKNEAEGVARISGLEPPVVTGPPVSVPQTKLLKGPKGTVKTAAKRAQVKFRFSSTTTAPTFECALTKVKKAKKGKKAAQPKFKTCKSPKSFSLKPGKYRFWVRAVNSGVVDPTPAKRSFRVVHVHKR